MIEFKVENKIFSITEEEIMKCGIVRREDLENQNYKSYVNGDFFVVLFENGIKIRKAEKKSPKCDFPDTIDMNITDYCDNACPFCYNASTVEGKEAPVELIKELISSFRGCEIAFGGGDPMSHSKIEEILTYCRDRNISPNITVNQNHLKRYKERLSDFLKNDLLDGIGVSLMNSQNEEDMDIVTELDRIKSSIVIHVINGNITATDLPALYYRNVLILGYKNIGRGVNFLSTKVLKNQNWLKRFGIILLKNKAKSVSFDNLGLCQLYTNKNFDLDQVKFVYQGEEGTCSMYVNAVKRYYAINSITDEHIPFTDLDTTKMFKNL